MDRGTEKPRNNKNSFDGQRLRKLQLERARSSVAVSKEERQRDAFRRWSSMNEATLKSEAGPGGSGRGLPDVSGNAHSDASGSRPNYHKPFMYVLPDPKKMEPRNPLADGTGTGQSYSRDVFSRMKDDTVPDLAYPHGMPRWGPKMASQTGDSVEDDKVPSMNPNISSPPNTRAQDDRSSRAAQKAVKQARQEEIVEKARAQSVLAAARAIQNIASTSPRSLPKLVSPKKLSETKLGSRLLGGPTLLQSARRKQARVMQVSDHIRQTYSHDQQDEGIKQSSSESVESENTNNVEDASMESNSDHSEDTHNCDSLSIDESVAGMETSEEDFSNDGEDDAHGAATNPKSCPGYTPKRMTSPFHKSNRPGLSARLFGPKETLLQSARIQQAHVIQASNHARQSRSLDDALQHQEKANPTKAGARSVQSFEFLQSQTKATTGPEAIQVETVESDSDEEKAAPSRCSGDATPEFVCEERQSFAAKSDSRSWSMRTSSLADEQVANAEDALSIDDTIEDSVGASVGSRESELEEASKQPKTPQSTSIPTMILSEVDPESSSRLSDCSSSLVLNATNAGEAEREDVHNTEVAGQERQFNVQRCRELLAIRNRYLEQEERCNLLSQGATSRLSSIPPLFRGAKETTLLELSTRGRWLELSQNRPSPASTTASPFSASNARWRVREGLSLASMQDDGPGLPPISLVAPPKTAKPIITRKDRWHVASSDDNKPKQHKCNSDATQNNTTTQLRTKLRRFLVRCLYSLPFLLWATRASFLLRDKLVSAGNGTAVSLGGEESHEKVLFDGLLMEIKMPPSNSSIYPVRIASTLTPSSWVEMPIIFFDPPMDKVVVALPMDMLAISTAPPGKCFANLTTKVKKKFWEVLRDETALGHTHPHERNETLPNLCAGAANGVGSGALNWLQSPPNDNFHFGSTNDQTICEVFSEYHVGPATKHPYTEDLGEIRSTLNVENPDKSNADESLPTAQTLFEYISEIQQEVGTDIRHPTNDFHHDHRVTMTHDIADPGKSTDEETKVKVPIFRSLKDMWRRRVQQKKEQRQKRQRNP